jgi:Ca-activated chloride channel family protein
MEEAARSGRGTFTYIADPASAEQVMVDLFKKVERPVLTDIEISGSGIREMSPTTVPDLYYGEPLEVAMKLESDTPAITIKGHIGDTAWSKTVNVQPVGNTAGIRVDWARKKIADWERAGLYGASRDQIREAVIDLALTHHLVSTFTSLVAVDVTPVRAANEALRKALITPLKPVGLSVSFAQTALGFEKTLLFAAMLFLLGWAVLRASQQEVSHA